MSVILVCTACGARLEGERIGLLEPGESFVCPRCSRPLVETGYVQIDEGPDGAEPADGGREAA